MRENMTPEAQERMAKSIPVGRIATPDDVARVVVFLGSGWNTFVNGGSDHGRRWSANLVESD